MAHSEIIQSIGQTSPLNYSVLILSTENIDGADFFGWEGLEGS